MRGAVRGVWRLEAEREQLLEGPCQNLSKRVGGLY